MVAEAIQTRLSDPRIPPLTSVTRVEVSEDLELARVYVSALGSDATRALGVQGLQSAAGLLRGMLGRALRLRKTPALEFRLDESLRRSFETVTAIDAAMRELGEPPIWERADALAAEDDEAQAAPGPCPEEPDEPVSGAGQEDA